MRDLSFTKLLKLWISCLLPLLAVRGLLGQAGNQSSTKDLGWTFHEAHDPLDGSVSRRLEITVPGIEEGVFNLSARCYSVLPGQSFRSALIDIKSASPDLRFRLFAVSQSAAVEDTFGGQQRVTVPPPLLCPFMDVLVGGRRINGVQSAQCGNDHAATLEFLGDVGTMSNVLINGEGNLTGLDKNDAVRVFFEGLMKAQIAVGAAGLIQHAAFAREVLASDHFRVQLVMNDGNNTVIDVPSDAALKDFVGRCVPDATKSPPPIAEPESAETIAARKADAEADYQRHRAEEHAKMIGPTSTPDGFVYATEATRESRTFVGNVTQFSEALPEYIERGMKASSMPPADYTKEIAYLVNVARTCQLDPKVAAIADRGGFSHVVEDFGQDYEICGIASSGGPIDASKRSGAPASGQKRGLVFYIKPSGGLRGKWTNSNGLEVIVCFEPLRDDEGNGDNFNDRMTKYGVMFATVHK